MKRHLTVDRGNSATKLALWESNLAQPIATEVVDGIATRQDLEAFVGGRQVDGAIVSSVADFPLELLDGFGFVMALTPTTPVPLKNGYATPETLGSDRLAAAVGAATRFPERSLLVVDLGTASTYDNVTSDGLFAGGNIAPGLGMRLQALHDHTRRLPRIATPHDAPSQDRPIFGRDTRDAILNGCLTGIVAEIEYYRRALPDDTLVVLTGNNAPAILPFLPRGHVFHDPWLVGRGLNSILSYNEI